jgi:O-antigen ligase
LDEEFAPFVIEQHTVRLKCVVNALSASMREKVARYFNSGNIEQMPLHPHNAALQIWLEAGGIGAALTSLFVLLALSTAARRWPLSRPGAAASLSFAVAALLIAGLSYGIWQTWWLATLWLGAALARPATAETSK